MSVRRISINIPNPSDGPSTATLRLEAVPEEELVKLGYRLPPERLQIRSARILTRAPASTFAGCLDAIWMAILALVFLLLRRPLPMRPLRIPLQPKSAIDVQVAIDAAGARGAAALRLVDRRGGKVVGGVTVLVLVGVQDSPAATIPARNPCPLILIEDPYWLPYDSESDSARLGGPIPAGYDVDLVAWITNPTEVTLGDATAYLEHLGGAAAEFRAARWNLGNFEPGARFPLRWRIQSRPSATGRWVASIVVESKGFEPVRLRSPFELGSFAPIEVVPDADAVVEPN